MVQIINPDYEPRLTLSEGAKEFNEFRQHIKKLGILNRSYAYYGCFFFSLLLCYIGIGYAIYVTMDYFFLILLSILFGLVVGFIVSFLHDAGHLAIFHSHRKNYFFGILCGVFAGVNFSQWIHAHNAHHAHPNQMEKDPDLEVPFSFTHEHYHSKSGIIKWLQPYQAWLYFPSTFFLIYRLHLKLNVLKVIKKWEENVHGAILGDILISCLCFFNWYIVPFLLLDFNHAVVFIIVATGTLGVYMANVFAPNHKQMPQLAKETKLSFLEQQIITSCNIRPSLLTDFFYIGLNYQIEHHLIPDCPRNKLKLISPHVKELCFRLDLPYSVLSISQSYQMILGELSNISNESIGCDIKKK